MKKIAILPTGDWAEIEDDEVVVVELTEAQFDAVCNNDYSQSKILGLCDALDIDAHLGIEAVHE